MINVIVYAYSIQVLHNVDYFFMNMDNVKLIMCHNHKQLLSSWEYYTSAIIIYEVNQFKISNQRFVEQLRHDSSKPYFFLIGVTEPIQLKEMMLKHFNYVLSNNAEYHEFHFFLMNSLSLYKHMRCEVMFDIMSEVIQISNADAGNQVNSVGIYSYIIATNMKNDKKYGELITERFLDEITQYGRIHDIGKIGISDNILLKPGPLTFEEKRIVKMHTLLGSELIHHLIEKHNQLSYLGAGAEVVRYHHEHFDGSGYPDGLRGDEIPLMAKIVGLADVYDALTTKRVYKQAYSHQEATEIIKNLSGKQFDPLVVKSFFIAEKEIISFNKSRIQNSNKE